MDDGFKRLALAAENDQERRRAAFGVDEAAELLNNAAAQLKGAGKFTAAVIAQRRALALCPNSALLWNGYGAILWNLGRYGEAEEALLESQRLDPKASGPLANLAMVYASQKRFDEAVEIMEKSLALEPDNLHAHWEYAMVLLESGHWLKGWEEYEHRFQYRGPELYPTMPYPLWDGVADLSGKTVFLRAEQGVGDRVLFSRYVAWLKGKYPTCRILYMCGTDLQGILWGYRELCEFIPEGVTWPEADYGVHLMSLPKFHGSTPTNVPPDPGFIYDRVRRSIGSVQLPLPYRRDGGRITSPGRENALKVGIVWTGNPKMLRNHDRTIPLELMLELEENPDVQLYSLQFPPGQNDIGALGAQELVCDLAPQIAPRGFVGTAEVMLHLDLVITVCTSTAHLAGALGVPCWVLLCQDPYWVWLQNSRRSVWYPSVRLFRQPDNAPGDWRSVIDSVKVALDELVASRAPQALVAGAAE